VILGLGLPFLAVSLGGACLDYAGEELMFVCDAPDASTSASSSGAGSGSGSILPSKPATDCGKSATTSSSSGSANAP
jgi:hypothetical protein